MIDKNHIQKIFKNTYTEINTNHEEALDVFRNYLQNDGTPFSILVNYDSHSDLYKNSILKHSNLANWVNFTFKDYGVTEYYWIIPNYIIKNEDFKKNFVCKKELNRGPLSVYNDLNDIYTEELLFNKESGKLIFLETLENINKKNEKFNLPKLTKENFNLTPITINFVPFDKLSVLNGKRFALSIDADAFCNNGFDTKECIYNIEISKEELIEEFNIFIKSLNDINVEIPVASLTRSPAYFPAKFEKEIYDFYNCIKAASKI
jgi:hypothetical protein